MLNLYAFLPSLLACRTRRAFSKHRLTRKSEQHKTPTSTTMNSTSLPSGLQTTVSKNSFIFLTGRSALQFLLLVVACAVVDGQIFGSCVGLFDKLLPCEPSIYGFPSYMMTNGSDCSCKVIVSLWQILGWHCGPSLGCIFQDSD